MNFRDGIDGFIDAQTGFWNEATSEERRCKLGTIATRMEKLHSDGKISTLEADKMTRRDIQEFLKSMRDSRLETSTMKKYLQLVDQYLQHFENYSAMRVRSNAGLSVPLKGIEHLSKEEALTVMNYIDGLPGWNGSIVRGMIYLAYQTMARPSEIRLAKVNDLDIYGRRFRITNPKGNGRYADSEWVQLLFEGSVDTLIRYLEERERYLRRNNIESDWLFPRLYKGDVGTYTLKSVNAKMRKVSEATGIQFTLKTWRATVATWFCEYDSDLLQNVSDELRHKCAKTTDMFYARIRKASSGKTLTKYSAAIDVSRNRSMAHRRTWRGHL